ncbi:MAG: ABC transporter ATP-binding protein [Planctomycetes bacterium]|nr:ABC transporter ATP-binding protein [Planctomycetota bacterium]MBL7040657.1 ABC transporter ATP-binding protein [Pirellulaceae bacterium]
MDLAIRTEHLTKIYSGQVIAVNDMTLEVPVGSIYGLLGPNGAGKTTTLRLLLGLQRPTAGRAEIFGKTCGVNSTAVRHMIGYLPTHPKLPGHLRPIEYLDLLGRLCRLPSQVRKPRLTSLLRAVGLLGATNQKIHTFSTGMCTRLGIAASLLAEPPLLLWDEPTAGLDPAARRFTLDLIRELGKTRTVLVATHILSDIDQICDYVGVMHEGKMIFSGPMRDMKQRLKRDDITLELDGPSEGKAQLVQQVNEMAGISAAMRDPHTLVVELADGRARADALTDVMKLIDSSSVTLQTIHSGQNETEYAYLQLLQEDKAHGFQRFDIDVQHEDDAVHGDSSS